jgi:class 3 adenylate cyclase
VRRTDCAALRRLRSEVHGDGVLVYFGYPQAHEDDAERAVRAGLELVAAVGTLKAQASLRTRVGIATGLVGCWRLNRLWRIARASHRRRNAEPRRATARDC